jgi:exodeoxyribonuclease-3
MNQLSVTASKRAASLQRRMAALEARTAMIPTAPAPDRFRIATWNVNSLRSRLPAIERFIERTVPDVICLQETKATTPADAATALFERLGYVLCYVGGGAYNGVAIASRHPIDETIVSGQFGNDELDREPRVASCVVHTEVPIRVASVYVPHGREVGHWHYDYKLAFLDALTDRAKHWLADGSHLVVCGDINVAATDSDIFHPDAFVGLTHVTVAERSALARLLEAGLVDVDVARWGAKERRFTWWNHGLNYSRNLGMRIDIVAADSRLASSVDTTWIDHLERAAERPSDHAALIADFRLAPSRHQSQSSQS